MKNLYAKEEERQLFESRFLGGRIMRIWIPLYGMKEVLSDFKLLREEWTISLNQARYLGNERYKDIKM
jgi:hypothetical protein